MIARTPDRTPNFMASSASTDAPPELPVTLRPLSRARTGMVSGSSGTPSAKAMSEAIEGLSVDGVLVALGVPEEPIVVSVRTLLSGRKVTGSSGGVPVEVEDAMKFGVRSGVRPIIETMPLERAAEAYDRMMAGQARFRVVLTTGL